MKVEKAKIGDAQRIHELVNSFAERGEMLPRALSEIYENLRDFFVIRSEQGEVIGCVALHINWSDLAEIKSLAVSGDKQSQGLGSRLVKACLKEARELGIPTVFCLTYKPAFFEKHNFRRVDKMELPRKVWSECYRCPKFPDCDEVALIYRFDDISNPRV
jgi:amino-acid N-acetyltransferase